MRHLVLCLALSLIAAPARAEPPPREPPAGKIGPLSVALLVFGPEADESKLRACHEIFQNAGVTIDPSAPLVVRLNLGNNLNHLTIELLRRGRLLDEPRPSWRLKVLCRDALGALAQLAMTDPRVRAAEAAPPAGPTRLALDVTGSEADYKKLERCQRIFTEGGVVIDGVAPVQVLLTLGNGRNRVTVRNGPRVLFDAWRPGGWGMEQLCADALAQAVGQYRRLVASQPRPAPPPPAR
jgi:hypothetical protein